MSVRERIWLILRIILTAALAGCFLVRVVRIARNWSSVAQFYAMPNPVWAAVCKALFLGPFALILLTALAIWSKSRRGLPLGLFCFFAGGFFILEEGLTCFARSMNGHSGYVGAEPLLSLLACAAAAAAVLQHRSPRR